MKSIRRVQRGEKIAVYSSDIIDDKRAKSVNGENPNTEITIIITIRYNSIVEHRG
jgi:hypothetical protein